MDRKKILKEYIKNQILYEDDYGGYDGGGYDGGGYGGLGSTSALAKIFVEPFLDVAKTGAAVVSDISNKSQVVVGSVLATIISSFVPFFNETFEEIKQRAEERSAQIKEKYKEVFDRTNKSLWTPDGSLIFFMANPGAFIATKAAIESPEIALGLIDILAGQNAFLGKVTNAIRNKVKSFKNKLGADSSSTSRRSSHNSEEFLSQLFKSGKFHNENKLIIKEDVDIGSVLKNKQFIATINNTPSARKLKQDGIALLKAYLKDIIQNCKKQINVKNTKKLNKLSDGKFEDYLMNRVNAEERTKTAEYVANQTKKSIAKLYIDRLTQESNDMPEDIKKYYDNAIQQIKSM